MKPYKVTTKGRVTIPIELRKKFNIKSSTKLKIEDAGDGIKITPLKKIQFVSNFDKLKIV